jgi:hypothetical protein
VRGFRRRGRDHPPCRTRHHGARLSDDNCRQLPRDGAAAAPPLSTSAVQGARWAVGARCGGQLAATARPPRTRRHGCPATQTADRPSCGRIAACAGRESPRTPTPPTHPRAATPGPPPTPPERPPGRPWPQAAAGSPPPSSGWPPRRTVGRLGTAIVKTWPWFRLIDTSGTAAADRAVDPEASRHPPPQL